ncbi:MAG: glycosyltransferase [Clostridiales bacterium]|jgi:glycosyltransferase involved in cell wall biosynthesis|nr:glycosyltransferase [Clostridiales bacterium]
MIFGEEKLTQKLHEFEVDYEKYKTTKDKNGALTVMYTSGGVSKMLHSGYDAEKEGRDFAEKNYAARRDIAVFGLGLGYHVKALAAKLEKGRKLYVFETNLNIIKLAVDFTDIGSVLKKDNIVFYWADSFKLLQSKFYECMRGGALPVLYIPALLTVPSDHALLTRYAKTWNLLKKYKEGTGDIQKIKDFFGVIPVQRKKKYKVTVIGDVFKHQIMDSSAKNFMLAFESIGCDTNYISLKDLNAVLDAQTAQTFASSDFYITFHPSAIGEIRPRGFKAPLFVIGMDRPYAIISIGATHEEGIICTWHDRNDLRYANMYNRMALHRFLTIPAEIDFEPENLFKHERNNDVVIINSLTLGLDLFKRHSASKKPELRYLMEKALSKFRKAKGAKLLEECYCDVLNKDAPDDLVIALMIASGMVVDMQVRFEKRYSAVKALLEAGVNLHLFGDDWDLTDAVSYPNCVYYGKIDADTGRKFMESCKILVNTMPSWGMDAGHDRVLSAMIRGALCITDPTDYLREEFAEGEEIVFYDPNNLSSLTEKVNYYLRHEDERLRIAKQGFEKVKKYHTFINRAEEILNIFEELNSGKHILK